MSECNGIIGMFFGHKFKRFEIESTCDDGQKTVDTQALAKIHDTAQQCIKNSITVGDYDGHVDILKSTMDAFRGCKESSKAIIVCVRCGQKADDQGV